MTDRPGGVVCAKCGGHSTDPEFCSECGAAISAAPVPSAAADEAMVCPLCGEARPSPFARFCDTCRYDFVAQQAFSAAPPPSVPTAPPPLALPAPIRRWDLRATVDASLRQPDDPEPPDTRERLFPLDLADHLVGRRSDTEDIHPEIVIADPGISRRHLRLLRQADGAMAALDLGSLNGTRLNGVALEPNVATALAAGDQLTLGCWTRLVIGER